MKEFSERGNRKERKASRNFVAPTKDEATTGRFMWAGDSHGVGFKQPVGKESASNKSAVPMESKCFSPDDVI